MSSSDTAAAARYWGYLVQADKQPAPALEHLLLSIAQYISTSVAPRETVCITPAKLARFYRLVGGNFDPLFLKTPNHSLSFIYQSLGCFHTLQPSPSPYVAPSVPALTPHGFVRWQTVQLLLEPSQHVPFLQHAVQNLDLPSPVHGDAFPNLLPSSSLPKDPDPEMTAWYNSVANRLYAEAQACDEQLKQSSQSPPATSSRRSFRPTKEAAIYFHHPQAYHDVARRTQEQRRFSPQCPAHQRNSSYPNSHRTPSLSSSSGTSDSPVRSSPQNPTLLPPPLAHKRPALSRLHVTQSHPNVPILSQTAYPQRPVAAVNAKDMLTSNPRNAARIRRSDRSAHPENRARSTAAPGLTGQGSKLPADGLSISRAHSVGSRPLLGKYAGREAEDRGRLNHSTTGKVRRSKA